MKRLYVLVSKQLDPVYGCVQGGHAVAQYLLDHRDDPEAWNNEYLIYVYANVKWWKWKLKRAGVDFSSFYEPDLGNKLTAIAVVDSGERFQDLNLVRS